MLTGINTGSAVRKKNSPWCEQVRMRWETTVKESQEYWQLHSHALTHSLHFFSQSLPELGILSSHLKLLMLFQCSSGHLTFFICASIIPVCTSWAPSFPPQAPRRQTLPPAHLHTMPYIKQAFSYLFHAKPVISFIHIDRSKYQLGPPCYKLSSKAMYLSQFQVEGKLQKMLIY